MLDRIISERTGQASAAFGLRVGRIVQRVSRLVALPGLVLMLGGLLLFAVSDLDAASQGAGWTTHHPVLPLGDLASRALFSATGLMSAGLLTLVLVPLITVLLILVEATRIRRWQEAVVALVVAGILIFSIVLGRA